MSEEKKMDWPSFHQFSLLLLQAERILRSSEHLRLFMTSKQSWNFKKALKWDKSDRKQRLSLKKSQLAYFAFHSSKDSSLFLILINWIFKLKVLKQNKQQVKTEQQLGPELTKTLFSDDCIYQINTVIIVKAYLKKCISPIAFHVSLVFIRRDGVKSF